MNDGSQKWSEREREEEREKEGERKKIAGENSVFEVIAVMLSLNKKQ